MSLFKKNKNRNKVENPYYSLGLLQQLMVITKVDPHDPILIIMKCAKLKPT